MIDFYQQVMDATGWTRKEAKERTMAVIYEKGASALANTVPCTTCGTPTEMTGTKKCNRCWEVESRLEDYLRHPNARGIVEALIKKLWAA